MNYTVLYDAGKQGFQNWSQLVVAMLLVFLPGLMLWRQRARRRFPAMLTFTLAVFILLGMCMGILFSLGYRHYLAVQKRMSESKFQVVEGIVSNLHQPRRFSTGINGTRLEPAEFLVGSVQFRCWDKSNQRGHDFFQRSDLLQDGQPVRIYYINLDERENIITHLEVGNDR